MNFPNLKQFFFGAPKIHKRRTLGDVLTSPSISESDRAILRAIDSQMSMMLHSNSEMKRMYDASVVTNLNLDLPVSVTSANAEILVSIMAARSHARRKERDNPTAAGITGLNQDNIGGPEPFRLKAKVGKWENVTGKSGKAMKQFVEEPETNQKIEAWWKKAGRKENCSVRRNITRSELYWQAISAYKRDGGVIGRHHFGFPNNACGYAVDLLEIDRLDHYWNRPQGGENGNEIQFSIEMDKYGGPVAYHVLERHPGDTYAWSTGPRYRERVPAEDIFLTFNIRTRAEQLVGMPQLSSCIQRMHRMDQWDIAYCTAAIWSSCKPIFYEQELPTALDTVPQWINEAMQTTQAWVAQQGSQAQSIEPGMAEKLPYGVKAKILDPKFPQTEGPGFKKQSLRDIATGSQVPYHEIANDLEGVNFSSGRLGRNAYQATCKKDQNHFRDNFVIPHFEANLKYALLSGQLDLPYSRYDEFCESVEFIGVRWPAVDPLKDVQATGIAIELGLTSRDHEIGESERGGDVETVDAEIAAGREVDEAHELDFTGVDVTKPTIGKGEPGETVPGPADEPGSEPTEPVGNHSFHSRNGHLRV